jgi:release factor glutamine methyltransferase
MRGTVGALLCAAGTRLHAEGIPRREARLLLAHALSVTPEALLRDAHAAVAPDAAARFEALLARRLSHEPMALILGHAGFWTLDLEVSADTLIPRADSEALVELALQLRPPPPRPGGPRILDLGTGTGCLLLALLAEWPMAEGVGVDLNPAAAALAARNAARNGLADRARFLAGHWAGALDARFDLVLSNPPYIESAAIPGLMPEVALHEPQAALDGGADGLDAYRSILAELPRLLAPGGVAILELGAGQGPAVERLAASTGLEVLCMKGDMGGIDRAIALGTSRWAIGGAHDIA